VTFKLHPEARTEYREAIIFYGKAAEKFNNAVESAIAEIIRRPERFRELEPGVRICRVSRFPYSILYVLKEQNVTVLAIKHDRRNPDYWRGRL
jgi:plasmid stabilization system protein ParE